MSSKKKQVSPTSEYSASKDVDAVNVIPENAQPFMTRTQVAVYIVSMAVVVLAFFLSNHMEVPTAVIGENKHEISCGGRGVLSTPIANSSMSYDDKLAWMRKNQFPHLDDQVYLDYTGAGLYQIQQVEQLVCDLKTNLYGNAHSQSPSSIHTESILCEMRHKVLEFFNASPSEYTVIFTSGCTGALKLVGENFDFIPEKSTYYYLVQNHNSVLGIREYALERGATYDVWSESDVEQILAKLEKNPDLSTPDAYSLFAFPAEENFSGAKFPLSWINRFHNSTKKYKILLDAAAYVPNSPLDLTKYPADFVTMSFYKMFGFPTGLGALIARHDSLDETLTKRYFGGGTVSVACCRRHYANFHQCPHQRFEDGTVAFLTIASLRHGLDIMSNLGMKNIQDHLESLREYAYERLSSMVHSTGVPVFKIFGKHDIIDVRHQQGPILTFIAYDESGAPVGYNNIVERAAKYNIHIRAGTHCNPGAAFDALSIDENEFITYTEQTLHSCGDNLDLWKNKMPTGTVRVSFGYPTTIKDVDRLIEFINIELVH